MNRQQEKSSPSVSLSFLVWGLSVLLSLSVPLALAAQKKVIAQAEIYLKSGKELPKAEKLLADLLADSANQRNMKIRLLLFDAVRKQYEQGNEKLFLRQKYDTTSLFIATKKMFYIAEGIDSIDASPDKHGRTRLKYRKKNGEYLQDIRPTCSTEAPSSLKSKTMKGLSTSTKLTFGRLRVRFSPSPTTKRKKH